MSTRRGRRSGRQFLAGGHDESACQEPTPPSRSSHFEIFRYYELERARRNDGQWDSRPEFPSASEILTCQNGDGPSDIEVMPNRPQGPWSSTDEYLEAMYELLREDTIRPLREAVAHLAGRPAADEAFFDGAAYIYGNVHLSHIIFSTRGVHARVTFTLSRVGKKVKWSQSKRLMPGTVVVLSPINDSFKSILIAVVEARPTDELEQNPATVDLTFTPGSPTPLDSAVEYLMVEGPGCYYEASRHVLLGLQHMALEPSHFPLKEHLVNAKVAVEPPAYVLDDPHIVLPPTMIKSSPSFNTLETWPPLDDSTLDDSQLKALNRILTKRLAIIQGPPGTGKTHVSVEAIRVMLQNWKTGDAPIIVACQTNHAVDQLLRHISVFETEFARLGGRCKDKGAVKERTLYELRQQVGNDRAGPPPSFGRANKEMRRLEKRIDFLLSPLKYTQEPLSLNVLEHYKILTDKQVQSLESAANKWVQSTGTVNAFKLWLGKSLVAVPFEQTPPDYGLQYDPADWEVEQLDELEAENHASDEEYVDYLLGATMVQIGDNFKGIGELDDPSSINLLRGEHDLWKIKPAHRGPIYRFLQSQLKSSIDKVVQPLIQDYQRAVVQRRIALWVKDETILREQKIIGMTTTGLCKYRGLLASLSPKTVIIEEAAECLEPPIAVACMPTVEHLVLVGDHKQLRPHCTSSAYEGQPFWLNLSLFERMVNNGVEYTMLKSQRRMIPEVRRLLQPFYGDEIEDHPCVSDKNIRPDVPGMGGINTFFFSHQWPEESNANHSLLNRREAGMVVAMTKYLLDNGLACSEITILTFYNGQRSEISKQLEAEPQLKGQTFKVATVDSYQGEENHVILLSLVRSNTTHRIGFLEDQNRVCVALSRAQCGFYVFGNTECMRGSTKTSVWAKVIAIMGKHEVRGNPTVGTRLPLFCPRHKSDTFVEDLSDWVSLQGGCRTPCSATLPCGHPCTLNCHPFDHTSVACANICDKPLPSGHGVRKTACAAECTCKKCRPVKVRRPKKAENRDISDIGGQLMETLLIDFEDMPASTQGAGSTSVEGYENDSPRVNSTKTPVKLVVNLLD